MYISHPIPRVHVLLLPVDHDHDHDHDRLTVRRIVLCTARLRLGRPWALTHPTLIINLNLDLGEPSTFNAESEQLRSSERERCPIPNVSLYWPPTNRPATPLPLPLKKIKSKPKLNPPPKSKSSPNPHPHPPAPSHPAPNSQTSPHQGEEGSRNRA